MGFPEIKFGICTRCGGKSADYATPGSGNAAYRDSGNGLVLEYYDGKLMCPMCISLEKAKEESLISSERHADEEKFRERVGFKHSV